MVFTGLDNWIDSRVRGDIPHNVCPLVSSTEDQYSVQREKQPLPPPAGPELPVLFTKKEHTLFLHLSIDKSALRRMKKSNLQQKKILKRFFF